MDEAGREWFYMVGATRVGPVTATELRLRVRQGLVDPDAIVWTAGMQGWEPASLALPRFASREDFAADADASEDVRPVFFQVSPMKFVVMSVVTFGLYELYWSYKNWRYLKEHHSLEIRPFWRAWFTLLFHFSLLKRIRDGVSLRTAATFSPGWLTVAYLLFLASLQLPDPLWYIGFLSFLPMLPAVGAIDSANEGVIEGRNGRFSTWNIVMIVVWAAVWMPELVFWLRPDWLPS